jgi:hypothetical protein
MNLYVVREEVLYLIESARSAKEAEELFLGDQGIRTGKVIVGCEVPERDVVLTADKTWAIEETAEYRVWGKNKEHAEERFLSVDGIAAGSAITSTEVMERDVFLSPK